MVYWHVRDYLHGLAFDWGLTIDQVNFLFSMLLCIPLGHAFRTLLHPTHVSANVRLLVTTCLGVWIGWLCFGRPQITPDQTHPEARYSAVKGFELMSIGEALHFVISPALCYTLMLSVGPDMVHGYVFLCAMLYLGGVHIYRQATNYGGYSVDVSGPLMVVTQKITFVGYIIHNNHMSRVDPKRYKLDEHFTGNVPNVLEYFGYIFHFTGILAGPPTTFADYYSYIHGRQFKDESVKNHKLKEPSPVRAGLWKFVLCWIPFIIFTKGGPLFPEATIVDPSFMKRYSVPQRLVYVYISMLAIRCRYYFAWMLAFNFLGLSGAVSFDLYIIYQIWTPAAESGNNLSGLGFNGYDEHGNAKWNKISNVDIFGFEFGLNFKEMLDSWNITTGIWLRKTVYERTKHYPTLATYVMSAFWHGFYPGYYLTFVTGALVTTAARLARRKLRAYFIKDPNLRLCYHFVTWLSVVIILQYITPTFVFMDFHRSWIYWRSVYFFGHVACLVLIVICMMLPTPQVDHLTVKDGKIKTNGLHCNGKMNQT